MENGSLREILQHDAQHPKKLNSRQRLDISKGVAAGIRYIHSDVQVYPKGCIRKLVHRDIKTSNILLDDKMIPKVMVQC